MNQLLKTMPLSLAMELAIGIQLEKAKSRLNVLDEMLSALRELNGLHRAPSLPDPDHASPAPPDPAPQVKAARKARKVKETAPAPARRGRPLTIRDRIRAVLKTEELPNGSKDFCVLDMREALPKVPATNLCAALIGMVQSGELSSTGTGRQRRYQVAQLRSALSGLPPASERERTYAKFRETIKTHNLPEEA